MNESSQNSYISLISGHFILSNTLLWLDQINKIYLKYTQVIIDFNEINLHSDKKNINNRYRIYKHRCITSAANNMD